MHDIKAVRDDPDGFDAGVKTRGLGPQAKTLLDLDARVRAAVTAKQAAETERNALSKQIGQAKAKGDEAEFARLRGEVARLKDVMEAEGATENAARADLDARLAGLPNLPLADVPEGADEAANVEVRTWGDPTKLGFEPKDHVALGEGLGLMDFEAAAAMSGSRFVVLKGALARMERALAQFMLDLQTEEHGYQEVNPPFLVRDHAMFGTGQLPKFVDDQFTAARTLSRQDLLVGALEQFDVEFERRTAAGEAVKPTELMNELLETAPVREDFWLVPTAEVPLTNLVREQIVDDASLPRRYVAWTPCFRAEAGAAGRDTRGMIRMHQFHKVELVSITKPEDSDAELERMTGCAEEILKRLEIPYRVMLLSTGDMGFGARKTYDLEVWLPSQDTYREISSCSTCGDFQARRMNARFRRDGEKRPEFVHTLNGSGVAVGRALVAVLENYQNEDGSIRVPEALRPYMGGREIVAP